MARLARVYVKGIPLVLLAARDHWHIVANNELIIRTSIAIHGISRLAKRAQGTWRIGQVWRPLSMLATINFWGLIPECLCLEKIGLFLSRLNRPLYRPAILAMHDKDDEKQTLADGPLLDAEERKAIFNVLDSFR